MQSLGNVLVVLAVAISSAHLVTPATHSGFSTDPQMPTLYLWEVMTIALPDSRARATVSQSRRRATGSMPVDGSSRKMTAGSPMRAMPVLSLRLLPPLEVGG